MTGARKKFPSKIAMEPPAQNSASDMAQMTEKRFPLPVILRTSCASKISRRKTPAFFLPDDSLISSRMLFFGRIRNANRPSVNSTGFIPNSKNAPTIIPAQAKSWIAVIRLSPPSFLLNFPIAL